MRKVLIKLLNKFYSKEFINLQTFNDKVKDIAENHSKNHYKVTVSCNPINGTMFSGYVEGHWTVEYKTINEVLDDLIKYLEPVKVKNIEVIIEND